MLFEYVDLHICFISQTTVNLAALRVRIDIIWLDQAARHQLSHQGMIGRQLIELLTSQHVGTTIPNIYNIRMLPRYHKTCNSRTHVGFIKLVLLAEHRICVFNCATKERNQGVFVERRYGSSILFGFERLSQ